MIVEVRYTRSFLHDLKSLETSAYEQVYNFIFYEFPHHWQMRTLPQLRQLDDDGIFHRFTVDNYLIGIEVRGEIVKFLCVIPMPDV
ncbi:cytotoxic translational repressor of toxin-antitoxin stability system [Calothrix sp. FACHB-1219]|uniref:cytotoxic translational repressor of toxin-antitoxin stability system n=1 Tax=unclassified Calothrix TaxID=2619626 RepID=UPI00168A3DC2|nr:cytotoxic translational repressor of toxin-antitoxin stability system [Calothrix sp. FACHB-168]MBD2203274.1 cytotoxic translational repressor of toxin-antitoxin stability system [Calothrix sp. FACHB-168]MBD2216430.1 cytotoxic translational repressor of toxin-antitoxin stability system [Calothrix sp. FACHB-1219]